MALVGPSVTTTNLKSKGFRCNSCMEWKPVVTKGVDGRQHCDDCVSPRRRSPVTVVD